MQSAPVRAPWADTWVSLFGSGAELAGAAPSAGLRRSWARCAAAGIARHRRVEFNPVSRSRLREIEDRHAEFVRLARPELERLAHAVVPAGMVVLLADADGVVLDVCGDLPALAPPLRSAARRGVDLSEAAVGSNALSVAAADDVLNLVGLRQHYCDDLRDFFCVAAPICDPRGRRIGILDVTSFGFVPRFDAAALLAQCAIAIENAVFVAEREHTLLRLHARSDLLDSPLAGLVRIGPDRTVSAVNRAATALLGMSRAELQSRPVEEVFSAPLDMLLGTSLGAGRDIELRCPSGLALRVRAQTPLPALRHAEESLAAIERRAVADAIARHGGNISAAARTLGLSRTTIYRKLRSGAPKRPGR